MAASATASLPGTPLVLWEPTLDPRRFFHEGFRTRLMRVSKEGQGGASAGELADELKAKRFVDLMGFWLDRAIYDSCIGRTLDSEFGNAAHPVLIVQIGSPNVRNPSLLIYRFASAISVSTKRPKFASAESVCNA